MKKLTPFTLDEIDRQDYAARLRTLLWHAGVLERILPRLCFFNLPTQTVRTVIAIVCLLLPRPRFSSINMAYVGHGSTSSTTPL